MILLDGPFTGREVPDPLGTSIILIPSVGMCDKSGCLFFHVQTDEYFAHGPNAGRLYRSYTALAEPEEPA